MMRRSTIQPQSMYHSPQRTVVVGFLYNILGSRVANLLGSIPSRICGSHRAQAFEAAANVLTVRQVIDAVVRSMRSTVQYRVWIPRVQYGHVVNALPGPANGRHFGGFSQPKFSRAGAGPSNPPLSQHMRIRSRAISGYAKSMPDTKGADPAHCATCSQSL